MKLLLIIISVIALSGCTYRIHKSDDFAKEFDFKEIDSHPNYTDESYMLTIFSVRY